MKPSRPTGFLKPALFVVFVALLFAATVIGYTKSGKTHVEERSAPVTEGVNVAVDLVSLDPEKQLATVRLTLFPQGSYLDKEEDEFAVALRVTSRTQKESGTLDIDKGQPVGGSYEFDIPVHGNPQSYPLDRFEYSYSYAGANQAEAQSTTPLVRIEKILDDGRTVPAAVGAASDGPGGLDGWTDRWRLVGEGPTLYVNLVLERSGAVITAAAVIVFLVVAMATLAAVVAWSVATRRRPIEATMASWFGAMLFALIPLQGFMPGAPPVGAWIDVFVFLWVEITLLTSMGVFIISWLRYREVPSYPHLRSPDEPAES